MSATYLDPLRVGTVLLLNSAGGVPVGGLVGEVRVRLRSSSLCHEDVDTFRPMPFMFPRGDTGFQGVLLESRFCRLAAV